MDLFSILMQLKHHCDHEKFKPIKNINEKYIDEFENIDIDYYKTIEKYEAELISLNNLKDIIVDVNKSLDRLINRFKNSKYSPPKIDL